MVYSPSPPDWGLLTATESLCLSIKPKPSWFFWGFFVFFADPEWSSCSSKEAVRKLLRSERFALCCLFICIPNEVRSEAQGPDLNLFGYWWLSFWPGHARQDVRTSIRGADPTASDYETTWRKYICLCTHAETPQLLTRGEIEGILKNQQPSKFTEPVRCLGGK